MELIDKKQYDKAVERLSAIAQQVGSQEHGSVDELDLERLQLEPTKPFKKVRSLQHGLLRCTGITSWVLKVVNSSQREWRFTIQKQKTGVLFEKIPDQLSRPTLALV